MITRTLNPQAIAIEDAQTEIRQTVLNAYFKGLPIQTVRKEVDTKIIEVKKRLTNPTLIELAPIALLAFAQRLSRRLILDFGNSGANALKAIQATLAVSEGKRSIDYETRAAGVPTQTYAKSYMRKVTAQLKDFAEIEALDTDDISGRNSLRNKAEMEVRYQDHSDRISALKARGVKLVVCSVHADCSDRCFPWQGKIYSLDGTSGTIDGRSYQPLETATDYYYTTKAGKKYKNGLLGFNCRHFLYEYREGMAIPRVSRATQQRENAINARQRELEQRVRRYREEALTLGKINPAAAAKARADAIKWNNEYRRFSRDNGRAYYPDRVKILT